MGSTLAEKILSIKSGRQVKAGDIIVAEVDLVFMQDSTGPLAVRQFQAAGFQKVAERIRKRPPEARRFPTAPVFPFTPRPSRTQPGKKQRHDSRQAEGFW